MTLTLGKSATATRGGALSLEWRADGSLWAMWGEEVEIRRWRVETQQGPRTFQTRLDDWPRTLPHGGLLIRDLAGDLYHLVAPERLDRESRELLWAFVD